MERIIWQYWETRGQKPAFVDGLHRLACRNSGCEVILVEPHTLSKYLPGLPKEILKITELAHKADMIRAMLVAQHGGMWLDSDAIVMKDLRHLYDYLSDFDFVGFNNGGILREEKPWVRVNCFLSKRDGLVACTWVQRQHAKFPKIRYGWEEIGTEILHPICLENRNIVKILPFESICPIPWHRVEEFAAEANDRGVIDQSLIVMLSNASLGKRLPSLRRLSCQDIAEGNFLLSDVMRTALRGNPVDERTGEQIDFTSNSDQKRRGGLRVAMEYLMKRWVG